MVQGLVVKIFAGLKSAIQMLRTCLKRMLDSATIKYGDLLAALLVENRSQLI